MHVYVFYEICLSCLYKKYAFHAKVHSTIYSTTAPRNQNQKAKQGQEEQEEQDGGVGRNHVTLTYSHKLTQIAEPEQR
jgi:hypothetical protein